MASTKTRVITHWDGRTEVLRGRLIRPKPVKFADLTPDEFAHAGTCFHEAAHAVAGVVFGATVGKAVAGDVPAKYRDRDLAGLVAFSAKPTREAVMLLAGPVATAKWNAGCGRRPTRAEVDRVLDDTGCHDREAIEAAVLASGGERVGDVFAETVNLVEQCWGAIVTLAVKLHKDGEADHRDVCAALSIPAKENAFHLSHIRGGKAPGSFTVTVGG